MNQKTLHRLTLNIDVSNNVKNLEAVEPTFKVNIIVNETNKRNNNLCKEQTPERELMRLKNIVHNEARLDSLGLIPS